LQGQNYPSACLEGDGSKAIWAGGSKDKNPPLTFSNSYVMQERLGKQTLYIIAPSRPYSVAEQYSLLPDDLETNPLRLSVAKMTPPVANLALMAKWQRHIMRHRVWHTIEKLLRNMAVKVDNIVCLALGPPNQEDRKNVLNPRTSAQHLVACCAAKFLAAHYGQGKQIPIVAHNPAYTVTDLQLLSSLPHRITIVSSPYQCLSITPNTLVFIIYAPVFIPIFEIITDSLFPSGPAAMFCTELQWQPWHENGHNALLDQRVPSVAKMLELYYEPLWLGDDADGGKDTDNIVGWFHHPVFNSRME
jgi:hypothetical protein